MAEEIAKVGELEICYETFGEPGRSRAAARDGPRHADDRAGRRRSAALLAERGFFVIRYDNRDVGRSTHLRELPAADDQAAAAARQVAPPRYSLADMAADGIGLLDTSGSSARTSSAPRWAA